MSAEDIQMTGVREYGEGFPVVLILEKGRLAVQASNECGYNSTSIDLQDLIDWVKKNRPELLQ